ncbi:MAG: hypothetical protein A3F68_10320 [Acidobacteria bacterium RIFCSPLOWO2_12_FULL_54_10]|nr:MAG: hypothetical protein A3F68_10320 [Acidobacteria bacterium RIFCSPLOWO2_12_FULL_54_10]
MESAYLNRLPNDIRDLVQEIEDAAGIEIEIRIDAARAKRLADDPDPLACEADENGARILIPAPDHFPESSALHELLHIRRFLVDGVPKIVVCEDNWIPQLEKGLLMLDNNLEHLVIIPEELKRRPERRSWWIPKFQRILNELSSAKFAHPVERDNHAFVAWVSIRHVLGEGSLLDNARQILERMDLYDRAERLFEIVAQVPEAKERVTKTWLEHIGLPLNGICFEYIDIWSRTTDEISIATG